MTIPNMPAGEYSWLTVVSPEGVAGVELVLEPAAHAAAREFQRALYRDGIPATSFESADVRAEFDVLRRRGVVFRTPPSQPDPQPSPSSTTPAATGSNFTGVGSGGAGRPRISLASDVIRFEYVENRGGFLSLGAELPDVMRTGIFSIGTAGLLAWPRGT